MSATWLGTALLGAVVVAASIAAARGAAIPAWEARVFHRINGLPDALYAPLWPFMQLGNLVVGTLAGLVVAWGAHDVTVAIGVLLAMALKLVAERVLRRALAGKMPARVRPGTSETGATLRGDVPHEGRSFPSGHVVLVAAIACVVAPVLPTPWDVIPLVLAVLVMVGRVYVAAHNPLDVTCGLGVGLVLGGIVASLIR